MIVLFKIGDKVVCPKYGIGILKNIEDRDLFGTTQTYYVIESLSDNMTISIPFSKSNSFHLRPINSSVSLEETLHILKQKEDLCVSTISFKERYSLNKQKLASGFLNDCSEVVRDLNFIKKSKSLNSSERTQFAIAKQLVTDEISLIKNISKEQAVDLVDTLLA